jgi:hypothetical protein
VLAIGGCAARYVGMERQLQREVFPEVRGAAAGVHGLAEGVGLRGREPFEVRTWRDPFCQLSGLPANRLSVARWYDYPPSPAPAAVEAEFRRVLAAEDWAGRYGGRYRLQLTPVDRDTQHGTETPALLIEVRNEVPTTDGCY